MPGRGVEGARVRFRYEGLDERVRFTEMGFAPRPQLLEGTCGRWELDLPPHRQICLTVTVAMAVTSLKDRGCPGWWRRTRLRPGKRSGIIPARAMRSGGRGARASLG